MLTHVVAVCAVLAATPHGIIKTGTVDTMMVETSPLVWQGRLMRMESVHGNYYANEEGGVPYLRIRDVEGGNMTKGFGLWHQFASAMVRDGVLYVFAGNTADPASGRQGNQIAVFWSSDLQTWQNKTVVTYPGGNATQYTSYNNDVWYGTFNGRSAFVMAIEFGAPQSVVGNRFTLGFAVTYATTPTEGWELLDTSKYIYNKDYYSACPAIWYLPSTGYWYIIYLRVYSQEPYKTYAEDIVRTKDFLVWDEASTNPFLWKSPEDYAIAPEGERTMNATQIQHAQQCSPKDINNSDIDFIPITTTCAGCPTAQPSVYINYNWGDQQGDCEFLTAGWYNGTIESFLEGPFQA